MDEFQRRLFDNLLRRATDPSMGCISRELVSRAFGYIDGLMEGNVIQPTEYSSLFDEIRHAESVIASQPYQPIWLAS
jgi:hypothetical protein